MPPETPEEVTQKLRAQRDYWEKQAYLSRSSELDVCGARRNRR